MRKENQMTKKVTVVGPRVLIKKDPVQDKSAGGIIISSEQQKKLERLGQAEGTVLQIGHTCFKDSEMIDVQTTKPDGSVVTERVGRSWCKVGDRVIFQRHAGMRIPDTLSPDGYVEDLVIVLDQDIVAVIEAP
jgi:co-chaperonin GroES (HSP10)